MTGSDTSSASAHHDTFCADHLPPPEQWPMLTGVDHFPARLNAADYILAPVRGAVRGGVGSGITIDGTDTVAYRRGDDVWSYERLDAHVGSLASVLTDPGGFGLVPGNRVMIRGFNAPETAAAILACLHAGLVAVPTMPLLRASELDRVADRSAANLILTDTRLRAEVEAMAATSAGGTPVAEWGPGRDLDERIAAATPGPALETAATDVAMLMFTSGTTGDPKAACQLHRDVAAICETAGEGIYGLGPSDIVTGTPPLAFAYGFGAFCAFPLRAGATTVLIEQPSPGALIDAIETHRATVVYTAPTAYRALLPLLEGRDISSMRYGASAGETLPAPTFDAFLEATGVLLLDGIGSTELLHIFLSNRVDNYRSGSTGLDIPGYENRVVDDDQNEVGPGEIGHLEVKGPTGCLYLDDERQATYVRNGWNRTGDLYIRDSDGWFWYQSRADDLIVSSGYNVAGPEVEACLLGHAAVAECAVIGVAHPERGQIIKAFVVPSDDANVTDTLATELQDHVKSSIAPYKYPREIEFRTDLPKTGTGKIQRYVLRQGEAETPTP